MEAQSALVRADGTVELHAVAKVYVYLAAVVNPRHAERHHALRLDYALYYLGALKLWVLVVNVLHRYEHLFYCLQVLKLARMLLLQGLHYLLHFHSNAMF